MRQVEISRTIVFVAPRHARGFFEALVADNPDIGRPRTEAPGSSVRRSRTRRYRVPPDAARTIAALLARRDHVIAPILAGVRSPRRGRRPAHWAPIDRDYETLRADMRTLFDDLGISTIPARMNNILSMEETQAPRRP